MAWGQRDILVTLNSWKSEKVGRKGTPTFQTVTINKKLPVEQFQFFVVLRPWALNLMLFIAVHADDEFGDYMF